MTARGVVCPRNLGSMSDCQVSGVKSTRRWTVGVGPIAIDGRWGSRSRGWWGKPSAKVDGQDDYDDYHDGADDSVHCFVALWLCRF